MKKLVAFTCFQILLSYSFASLAQTNVDPAEISSTVQELYDFHEVIYPMWHDAYPSKDYSALKGFVPAIKSNVESINNAKLPGILREKEPAWKKQLVELNKSAQDYYAAASGNDNTALLTAAENLHTSYERMARVLRPALKEIDDFHQTLYVIYHKLLPDSKFDEIAGLTDALGAKAEAIANYPQDNLKKRLGEKLGAFGVSSAKLRNSVSALKEVLKGNDPEKKKEAVENMHKAYQELDSLFE